jgi:hypothetical protein
MEGWSFLHFSHFSKDRKKSDKKCSQDPLKAPKLKPRWASWRHHGPSWAQLAANLAHLASILGPSSPQLRQKSPPNPQEAPPDTPRRPRGSPEGSRTAPGSRIVMVWGVDFGPHFSIFSAVSPSILHGLPASSSRHVAAWRAQRIVYISAAPRRGVGRV